MSLQEITALIRRHLVAVLLVAAVAMGVAVFMKRTPLMYQESCTVVFYTPTVRGGNPYGSFNSSLVQTAGTMALLAMSPQGQQQVRATGGTAAYDVAAVNSYSLEYPEWSLPDVTVTASSHDPNEAHRTFTIVTRLLQHQLAVQQAGVGVEPAHQIGMFLVNDDGPLATPGSSKRTFAGLLVLAIVAVFSVACFLDRHPVRFRLRALRPPWATSRPAGSHGGEA